MKSKAQTSIEYIVIMFFFIVILSYISITFISNLSSELRSTNLEEACIQSETLEAIILKEQGEPFNWENSSSLSRFGLMNNSKFYDISYEKWKKAQEHKYPKIRNSTPIDGNFQISYQVYAFKFGINDTIQ